MSVAAYYCAIAFIWSLTAGNGVVIHLPGLFEEAEKNVRKGKGVFERLQNTNTADPRHASAWVRDHLPKSYCMPFQVWKAGRSGLSFLTAPISVCKESVFCHSSKSGMIARNTPIFHNCFASVPTFMS